MKKFLFLLLTLLLLLPPCARAESPAEIRTPEDLQAMEPQGSYILMADLDMTDIPWPCPAFSGTLDGNGHTISNLTLTRFHDTTVTTLDGNEKRYETQVSGLFGRLENATVENLKLENIQALLTCDTPAYLGTLAGYCVDSRIINCEITGTLELRAYNGAFGVGGVIGYGSGFVQDTTVTTTLITVDTDDTTRDEQFLGGVAAMGFPDVQNCTVTLDGYISEHGYVHSGGLCGLYMQYPLGSRRCGRLEQNTITGQITFFEDNPNRRAYCDAIYGEILAWNHSIRNNVTAFHRNEVTDYTTELRPATP